MTEAPLAENADSRLKAAGPTAAAIGIITTIVGVSLLVTAPDRPARQVEEAALLAPAAATAAPETAPAQPLLTGPADSDPPLIGVPQVQNQPGATGAVQTSVEIVVKFKDDGRVKDIIDAFWRDQASAKAKFAAWKANRPEFAGLRLDRVTYSNELVLVHDGSAQPAQLPAIMRAIAARLGAASDISYAEPNMTAHPGGQ